MKGGTLRPSPPPVKKNTTIELPCGKRQEDRGLVPAGYEDLRAALIQFAKRLPRQDAHWKEFKERLRKSKPANVVTAAIANRWLRHLFHELKGLVRDPAEATAA